MSYTPALLVLVAVVFTFGAVVNEASVSPFTKPAYFTVKLGFALP